MATVPPSITGDAVYRGLLVSDPGTWTGQGESIFNYSGFAATTVINGEVVFDGDGNNVLFNVMGADYTYFEKYGLRVMSLGFILEEDTPVIWRVSFKVTFRRKLGPMRRAMSRISSRPPRPTSSSIRSRTARAARCCRCIYANPTFNQVN